MSCTDQLSLLSQHSIKEWRPQTEKNTFCKQVAAIWVSSPECNLDSVTLPDRLFCHRLHIWCNLHLCEIMNQSPNQIIRCQDVQHREEEWLKSRWHSQTWCYWVHSRYVCHSLTFESKHTFGNWFNLFVYDVNTVIIGKRSHRKPFIYCESARPERRCQLALANSCHVLELVRLCYSSPGKQRLSPRTAGSEHQGSDGSPGRAPRFPHAGPGDGAAEKRRGLGRSSDGETQPDGTRRAPSFHPGATERNRPALLRAGGSPDSQQVCHVFTISGVHLHTDWTGVRLDLRENF